MASGLGFNQLLGLRVWGKHSTCCRRFRGACMGLSKKACHSGVPQKTIVLSRLTLSCKVLRVQWPRSVVWSVLSYSMLS